MNWITPAAASALVSEGILIGNQVINITGISPTLNTVTLIPRANTGTRPVNHRAQLIVGSLYCYATYWDDGTEATGAQYYYQIWRK